MNWLGEKLAGSTGKLAGSLRDAQWPTVPHQECWPVNPQNDVSDFPISAQTRWVGSWLQRRSPRVSPLHTVCWSCAMTGVADDALAWWTVKERRRVRAMMVESSTVLRCPNDRAMVAGDGCGACGWVCAGAAA